MNYPMISCLCPTYKRPKMLENAMAMFWAQDYPNKELIILDDAGQYKPQKWDCMEIVSTSRRFRSLPEKFNALAGMARGQILMVWEDDDIYTPLHLIAHREVLRDGSWSKPSTVWSLYPGYLAEERSHGRFHASIGMWRKTYDDIGGWPITRRADFDQQMIKRLTEYSTGRIMDPMQYHPKTYVFRWASTNHFHAQGFMKGPDDESWYDNYDMDSAASPVELLQPRLDEETKETYRRLGFSQDGGYQLEAAGVHSPHDAEG